MQTLHDTAVAWAALCALKYKSMADAVSIFFDAVVPATVAMGATDKSSLGIVSAVAASLWRIVLSGGSVVWQHVRAHSGQLGNECADILARGECDEAQRSLPHVRLHAPINASRHAIELTPYMYPPLGDAHGHPWRDTAATGLICPATFDLSCHSHTRCLRLRVGWVKFQLQRALVPPLYQ